MKDMNMKTKQCSKCKEVKPVDCFSKRKSRKGGLQSYCKSCRAEYYKANREKIAECSRKHYEANRGKLLEYKRNYSEENREKLLEYKRKYYEENREKLLEYGRKYYEENKAKFAGYGRKYREENADKIAEKDRKYREANPEKVAERKRKYREENPAKVKAYHHNRRASKANAAGTCSAEQLKARFDYYGNRCAVCGSDEKLHADHRIPLSRGGSNHPANFIPLCQSCNLSKGTKTEAEFKQFFKGENQ